MPTDVTLRRLNTPVNIHPGVNAAVSNFQVPQTLGFGTVIAPIMYRIDYADGRWGEPQLLPYGPVSLDPAAKIFHWAQIIFEGLKAYFVEQEHPVIFRPEMNASRLNSSAQRMLMPMLPQAFFLSGLYSVAAYCQPFIPRAPGESLYLRPLMYGTQPSFGLGASDSYTFLVIASPSEVVISGALRVIIEREGSRAAEGGTGGVKVSGNYGASLQSTAEASAKGYSQPLWLDAAEHRYIEELSIMNFFAVIDGALYTPPLGGTILPGVTRDSVVALARARGIEVHERPIDINELLNSITSGACTEAFACGTAAIIAPISTIGERDGRLYEFELSDNSVAALLRRGLLDIQEGRAEDSLGWMRSIPQEYFPVTDQLQSTGSP